MLLSAGISGWLISAGALCFAADRLSAATTRCRFERHCATRVYIGASVIVTAESLSLCGALNNPWCWLGVGALFASESLFIPAVRRENSAPALPIRWKLP